MQTQPANDWLATRIEPRHAHLLRLVAACLLLIALPLPLAAQSDGTESAAGTPFRTIHVALVGAQPASNFSQRLASWFSSGTHVEVRNEPKLDADRILAPKHKSGVYVWIQLRSAVLARVYFVVSEKDARQRYLVQDVDLEDGVDELGAERLAQVLYSSVIALWQGRLQSSQAEVERRLESSGDADFKPAADASPMSGEPAHSEPQRETPCPSPGYSLGTGYGLNARGDEGMAHGPQLWIALVGGCPSVRLGGYMSARYLIPVERSADDVTLSVTGSRLRLGALLQYVVSTAVWLEVGVGAGGDVIRYEPDASAGLTPERGETELRPAAAVLIGPRFLAGAGGIAIFGELDVQLQDTHYDVARQDGLQTVLSSWRLQPGVSVLVRFDGLHP